MAINPGIALGVQPSQPLDMLGAYGKAMSIKSLVDGARLQQQQGAALSQKMQFDQQDQALDLATKKIGIFQKAAAGLQTLAPEQRAAQYPFLRQEVIRLTGDNNIPEQYDEAHIARWATMGMDPKATQEAILAERQRMAMAELQGRVYGGNRGGAPAPSAPAGDAAINMQGDSAYLAHPGKDVLPQEMTMEERGRRALTLSDLINQDPRLAGSKFGSDAAEMGLKFSKEAQEAEGRGISYQKGTDGNLYVFRNGEILNGGNPVDTGYDVNKPFYPGKDKDGNIIPVANKPVQDFELLNSKARGVNISMRNETKEQDESSKVIGKGYGEQYTNIQQSEFASRKRLGRAERLEQLLDGVQTGKLTPMGTQLAGYAHALGFEIDPKLANKEAAIALENEMALELRNPAGGAGMPGAMSDADRNFLQNMSSFTNKTTQGRKLMMETYKAIAKRDAEIAKLARDYKKRNSGKFDEGFYDEIAVWSAQNPLFPDADAIAKEKAKRGLK